MNSFGISSGRLARENIPTFVLAATSSAAGKTLVSCAILAYLRAADKKVSAAKLGPDYIDAQFLSSASGKPCLNLDPWAMRSKTLQALMRMPVEQGAELLLVESAMGMFDGAADGYNTGSAYAFANMFSPELPIVLLLSAKGCSGASLAAMARGFLQPPPVANGTGLQHSEKYPHNYNLPKYAPKYALLINHVASSRHQALIERELQQALPEVQVLGFLPHEPALSLPSRHLGLVQPEEIEALENIFAQAATWIAKHLDFVKLIDFATDRKQGSQNAREASREGAKGNFKFAGLQPPAQRIAIAQDKAFRFFYHGQAELWRNSGVEITFFSPLANETPDASAEWVYLPGGYPELNAEELASKTKFLDAIRAASSRASIYAECGGYICLGETLEDAEGKMHKMAGLLPLKVSYKKQEGQRRRARLLYASAQASSPIFGAHRLRGHIFHTAKIKQEGSTYARDSESLFAIADAKGVAQGTSGLRVGNVCGSFFHAIDCLE